jgi:hypothetical protein
LNFYANDAIHIHSNGAVQGREGIQPLIDSLINDYPDAEFALLSQSNEDNIYNFHWKTINGGGVQIEGKNTIGLTKDKINYHYAFIKPIQT